MISIRSLALTSCTMAGCLVASLATAVAQGPSTPALVDPYTITFDDLYQAQNLRWYSISQVRFVRSVDSRTGQPQWMGLAEHLDIAPPVAGSTEARFDLSFSNALGVDQALEARHAGVHGDQRAYLYQHASFRVQDPALAAANYTLHFQGVNVRLGRSVFNMAVVPASPEKSVWLLELDVDTGYPLSSLEYAPSGEVVSMLTVIDFAHDSAAQNIIGNSANWWVPSHRQSFATASAAVAAIPREQPLLEPKSRPRGYDLVDSRITTDALTGNRTLVLDYTDGVDSVHLLEFPGATPMHPTRRRDEYSILVFDDLRRRHMTFYRKDVQYLIIGSPTDSAIEEFAHKTLSEALKH